MPRSDGLFLAYHWSDPGLAVRMMLRLWNPPFNPGELVAGWLNGARSFEWWMTKVGHHPDHYHLFQLVSADGKVIKQRIQYGWSGNLMNAEDESAIMEKYKQMRALL